LYIIALLVLRLSPGSSSMWRWLPPLVLESTLPPDPLRVAPWVGGASAITHLMWSSHRIMVYITRPPVSLLPLRLNHRPFPALIPAIFPPPVPSRLSQRRTDL
jgi:hypothetical protein